MVPRSHNGRQLISHVVLNLSPKWGTADTEIKPPPTPTPTLPTPLVTVAQGYQRIPPSKPGVCRWEYIASHVAAPAARIPAHLYRLPRFSIPWLIQLHKVTCVIRGGSELYLTCGSNNLYFALLWWPLRLTGRKAVKYLSTDIYNIYPQNIGQARNIISCFQRRGELYNFWFSSWDTELCAQMRKHHCVLLKNYCMGIIHKPAPVFLG